MEIGEQLGAPSLQAGALGARHDGIVDLRKQPTHGVAKDNLLVSGERASGCLWYPAVMRRACLASLLVLACTKATTPASTPPALTPVVQTEAGDVVDTYHGVDVPDPYQWLEDWDNPDVKAWSAGQNDAARKHLDGLAVAKALRPDVEAILGAPVVSYSNVVRAGDVYFATKRQPPKPQPVVVLLKSLDDLQGARVLIDPSVLDAEGSTHVDWFKPSPDGTLLAASLSVGGSESGDVHIFDVATGERVHEVIPRVNGGTAGGDIAWSLDGKGLFYTRYPADGEREAEDMAFYQQLWFHKLGTPIADDRYELGKDFPRVAEIQLDRHPTSNVLLATVQKGDGGEFAHYIRQGRGKWKQFSDFGDRTVMAAFGARAGLYVVTRKDAPRGRLALTSQKMPNVGAAREIIPQGEDTIVSDFWGGGTIVTTKSRIYVQYQLGGPSEIRTFNQKGEPVAGPTIPPVSAVSEMIALSGDDLLFATTSYTQPKKWFVWDAAKQEVRDTALSSESPVDFSNVEVRREFAASKDGTKVPVNILMPKGTKLDGSNPCLVTGYGGFGVSLTPYQRSTYALLLSRGFVVAVANLRGGSEYGETWHEAGRLTLKQNVFDDFAGVLGHLVEAGYTKSERLAIEGGSNGGLLVGAALVQHPDLVAAVIARVGIYDMLRVELSSNGAFNISEFGTVTDKAQFEALHAYSPYHNVQDGTAYPAVLFMTGENDPRVDPMQSRKMTARMQKATSGGPVLLRTSANTGHGSGTPLSARVEETVDAYAFLLAQLGVDAD